MSTRPSAGSDAHPQSETDSKERSAALVRLIAYARDEALLLNAQFLAYCLDASLTAAKEELQNAAPASEDVPAPLSTGTEVSAIVGLLNSLVWRRIEVG